MPVRKYRSVLEMGEAVSQERNPNLGRIMRDLWEFTARLSRSTPPRGVKKCRSIEELNRGRALWS